MSIALARASGTPAQERLGDADAVLAAARAALGGRRLDEVKTFVAAGRTRQVRGDNLIPIEFEINCELPDKYVRRDEFPAQDAGPSSTGFSGALLIQSATGSGPGVPRGGGPPPPSPAQLDAARTARLVAVKQDFARLMLGLFAGSFSALPLTFSYAGTAEAPQGQADVLDVKGPANFTARLFVHKTTHLPVMVSWRGAAPERGGAPRGGPPPGPMRGEPPPSGAPVGQGREGGEPGARGSAPPGGADVETRLYFADYREIDGVTWPFRIRRAVGADTVDETTFDRFRVNVRIDAKKFEVK